jgi:hypothetical protein
MPKVIVLLLGAGNRNASLAEAAADGAMGVRFTEVDVRTSGGGAALEQRHKQLEFVEHIQGYDGVIIGGADGDDDAQALDDLLTALHSTAPATGWLNKVFAIVGGQNAAALDRVAQLGGIIVSEPRGADDAKERARAHGARVAKVTEWVRHALSHEQKEHHHHH